MAAAAVADVPEPSPDAILHNYSAALGNQARTGQRMEVSIYGSLPNLKKSGRLRALRHISRVGRITYQVLGFEGDNTVKKEVIARYLAAEMDAAHAPRKDDPYPHPSLAVTPDNYRFQYKGRAQRDGRDTFLFQVAPKRQRSLSGSTVDFFRRLVGLPTAPAAAGLFKGQIWIDCATWLPVEESGTLASVASIWVKRIDFVRKYEIRDGRSLPLRLESVADTRVVGRAELTIDYSNVTLDDSDADMEFE
jgi:hypothetical protein